MFRFGATFLRRQGSANRIKHKIAGPGSLTAPALFMPCEFPRRTLLGISVDVVSSRSYVGGGLLASLGLRLISMPRAVRTIRRAFTSGTCERELSRGWHSSISRPLFCAGLQQVAMTLDKVSLLFRRAY